jgi:hypothetical protein
LVKVPDIGFLPFVTERVQGSPGPATGRIENSLSGIGKGSNRHSNRFFRPFGQTDWRMR